MRIMNLKSVVYFSLLCAFISLWRDLFARMA